MKTKLLLLVMLLTSKLPAFTQNKVMKYCEVSIERYGFNDKVRALISVGKVDSLFSIKNSNLKIQLQKVNSLKTAPDVLNYMTSIGWTFIDSPKEYFIFKREFDSSELSSGK